MQASKKGNADSEIHLERAVFWQREEYRRVEKALGRKRSGQSGVVSQLNESGSRGYAGGGENVDEEAPLQGKLAEMEAGLNAEGQGDGKGEGGGEALLTREYARERWSRGRQSRLPSQEEWEEMFGKGVSFCYLFPFSCYWCGGR